MNQTDQQLQQTIVMEINGFLSGLDQMKIGFATKVQPIFQQLMIELGNRQKTIEDLQAQIKDMEKK